MAEHLPSTGKTLGSISRMATMRKKKGPTHQNNKDGLNCSRAHLTKDVVKCSLDFNSRTLNP